MPFPFYPGRGDGTPPDLPVCRATRHGSAEGYLPDPGLIDAVNVALLLGQPLLLTGEPGTGKTLEIPCNLLTFHDNELVDYREEALAEGFHTQWLVKCGVIPKQEQCIAYKQPLFLGGKDTIENLELSNLDVYWTLIGQLIRKARGFAHGTQIGKIGISE